MKFFEMVKKDSEQSTEILTAYAETVPQNEPYKEWFNKNLSKLGSLNQHFVEQKINGVLRHESIEDTVRYVDLQVDEKGREYVEVNGRKLYIPNGALQYIDSTADFVSVQGDDYLRVAQVYDISILAHPISTTKAGVILTKALDI